MTDKKHVRYSIDFEGLAVPVGFVGGGFVGGLQELEEGGVGVGGLAHGFVGEDEFAEVLVEGGGCGADGGIGVAGRFGVRVAVEEGFDAGGAGPEPGTADFVGVGVAGDAVGQVGHAWVLGGGPACPTCPDRKRKRLNS